MRGSDERTGSLFSYVGIKGRLRPDHPLRAVRALTDETLAAMERDLAALYSGIGRPSIAPQMLLRAMRRSITCIAPSGRTVMPSVRLLLNTRSCATSIASSLTVSFIIAQAGVGRC